MIINETKFKEACKKANITPQEVADIIFEEYRGKGCKKYNAVRDALKRFYTNKKYPKKIIHAERAVRLLNNSNFIEYEPSN